MSDRKRIAVLYSGQIRTWETALKSSKRYYETIHDADVDYFCHTWDQNEEVQALGQQGEIHPVHVGADEVDAIKELLNPVAFEIDSTPDDVVFQDRWMNLFYSFTKTVNMMKEHALKNNIKYDLIIKSRYDVVHNPVRNMPYHLMSMGERPFLLTSHCNLMPVEHFSYNFNDVVFFGNMYAMDLLANMFFDRHSEIKKFYDCDVSTQCNDFNHWDGPGVSIHKYMSGLNVKLHDLFEVHEYIVRENNDIDPLTTEGYAYYIQKHKEWYLK